MSAVSPLTSLSTLPEPGAGKPPSKTLGKDEFLRLLTTQLQHQDPLAPMDSQAFVAQLAQFASVEQLEGLGKKFDTMLVGQASANQMSTAALVGKEALFRADRISLGAGGARFDVTLAAASADAVAILADASGRVVRTLPLGARDAGTSGVTWDGLDAQGKALPPGEYVLTLSATGADGAPVESSAAVRGTISAVSFDEQVPQLIVSGRRVRLSDVLQISSVPAAT
jgi:flagellar basal-body rod modification protein FlgD